MKRLVPISLALLCAAGCSQLGPPQPEGAPPAAQAEPACSTRLLPKVLVSAFPLRYPEQIRPGEYIGWGETTAEALARALNRAGRLKAAAAGQRVVFANIEGEPELDRNAAGKPRLTEWAGAAQAQYVIAGVLADFGQTDKWLVVPERHLVMEAYLFDGTSGALIERREFARQERLIFRLPAHIAPGTREFAASRLGALYQGLIDEMAAWAQARLTCRPLPVRVTRSDGRRLTLDVGADGGLRPGMGLSLTPTGGPHAPRLDAIVREVEATHSIADLGFHRDPRAIRPGDVLYSLRDPSL